MEEKNSSNTPKKTSTRKTAGRAAGAKKPVAKKEVSVEKEKVEVLKEPQVEEVVQEEKTETTTETKDNSLEMTAVSEQIEVEEVSEEKVKKGLGAQPTKIAEPQDQQKFVIDLMSATPCDNVEEKVEEKRSPLYKFLLKTRIISYVIMGIAFAVMIFLLVTLFIKQSESMKKIMNVVQIVLIVFVICILAGNFIYSRYITKRQKEKVNTYLSDIVTLIAYHCFGPNVDVKDAKLYPNGKVEVDDVINAHLYTVINRIESRSAVIGTLDGVEIRSGDVAVIVPSTIVSLSEIKANSKVKEAYAIYGRYIAYDKKLSTGDGLMVCRRDNNCVLPDHLTRYQTVEVEGLDSSFIVYATSIELAQKLLTEEIKNELNSFVPNLPLLNYIISYNENGLFVATNYNDDYMAYPINKPVKENIYSSVYNDSRMIMNLLKKF